jgi:four helix bundle protein
METKKLQSFKDLKAWQKSSDLATLVYKSTDKFPKSELFGLINQMRRAVISISSNLAEGFKRNHKKEKTQFYSVAYGSVAELESQIEISYRLNYLNSTDYQKILSLTIEISKMIDGLIKSIRQNKNPRFYILILFLFLFSIFYILSPLRGWAATLFLMPQSEEIFKGDSFFVEVRLDTEGEEINTADVKVTLPDNSIEVIDFEKGGSIFTLWVKEPDIKEREISFLAGVPGGFIGNGLIGRINFLGKEVGKAEIDFSKDSMVLLNDGKGTPANLTFLDGSYEVLEKSKDLPVIYSSTNRDQNKWYKSSTLHLHWDLVSGAEYSYILSQDPSAEPDNTPDKPEGDLIWMGDMEYKNLEDGIYYFFLKQKLPEKDWSPRVTFRAMIDTTKPEEFKPEIAEIEGKKYLVFSTTDKISGVDHYEIATLNQGGIFFNAKPKLEWKVGKNPYLLGDQKLSKIFVKAIDKAGNEQISEITLPSKPFPYWIIPVIVICLLIIGWIIKKYFIKKR